MRTLTKEQLRDMYLEADKAVPERMPDSGPLFYEYFAQLLNKFFREDNDVKGITHEDRGN